MVTCIPYIGEGKCLKVLKCYRNEGFDRMHNPTDSCATAGKNENEGKKFQSEDFGASRGTDSKRREKTLLRHANMTA